MHRTLAAICVLFVGCGSAPPAGPTASLPSPVPPAEPAPTEPDDVTLRAALVGLRPRVELISQTCALGAEPTLVQEDRLCVLDADGRVRGWRSVSFGGRVLAARVDELVVFGVGPGTVPTRFARRWWRWDLRDDHVEPLPFEWNEEIARATSFGVLVHRAGASSARLVTHDVITEVRVVPGFRADELWRVGNETFVWTTEGVRRVEVRDGELVSEPFAQFGPGALRERRVLAPSTFVAWVEERARTSVQLLELPSADVITIPTGLRGVDSFRVHGRTVEMARGTQRVTIDLDTRSVTRARAPGRRVIFLDDVSLRPAYPVAVHDVRWSAGALVLTTDQYEIRIPTEPNHTSQSRAITIGFRPEHLPPADASECRCEGDARVCPSVRVEGACVAVEGEGPPVFDPSARFRVDWIERELLRVTRLVDGERLWLRVTTRAPDEGADPLSARSDDDVAVDLVAQTDDGAHEGASSPDDWRARDGVGSSAVLAPLPPPREGLIARFFTGESVAARP